MGRSRLFAAFAGCMGVVSFLSLFGLEAQANEQGDKRFDQYYSINESQKQNFSFQDPLNFLETQGKPALVYLLDWLFHDQALAEPAEPYKRQKHFGGWVVHKDESSCLNTRGLVLSRDSSEPVQLDKTGCRVVSGSWLDPYSGLSTTQAPDIQIDHMVPLKNAYISGAWAWDFQKRCLYANFIKNPFHLLAVSGHENMKKSDATPAGYMPPIEEYACQYLQNWLKIKLIWALAINPEEGQAIRNFSQQHGCHVDFMSLSLRSLLQQRQAILQDMDLCKATE